MLITVFGATGQVGKYVVRQALARGYRVRAFGRNVTGLLDADAASDRLEAIKGYVFEEADVRRALTGADGVISVLGGAFDGSDKTRSLGMKNIASQMQAAGVARIVALGGLGILNKDENSLLIEDPDYPAQYLPVGLEHLQAFRTLEASELQWTFVCSPDIIDEPDTGRYITRALFPPEPNLYRIHAGDLARFMLDELTANSYLRQRVGISAV